MFIDFKIRRIRHSARVTATPGVGPAATALKRTAFSSGLNSNEPFHFKSSYGFYEKGCRKTAN